MKKILYLVLVCPFRGHVSKSQFASHVCGSCGRLFC